MTCNSVKKAASERLDWITDYSDWLIDGDIISTAEADIIDDLTVDPVIEGDSVRLWVSGGTPKQSYGVRIKITTAQGRIKTECVKIRIK